MVQWPKAESIFTELVARKYFCSVRWDAKRGIREDDRRKSRAVFPILFLTYVVRLAGNRL